MNRSRLRASGNYTAQQRLRLKSEGSARPSLPTWPTTFPKPRFPAKRLNTYVERVNKRLGPGLISRRCLCLREPSSMPIRLVHRPRRTSALSCTDCTRMHCLELVTATVVLFHPEAALTALGMALPQTTLRWVLMLLVQCAEQLLRITKEPVVEASPADADEERRIELALAAGRLSSSYFSAHQSQLLVMTATFLAANLADRAGPRGARSLPYSILGCTAGFFRMDRLSALYFKRAREDAQQRSDRAVEAVIAIQECALQQGMARWDSLVSLSETAEAIAEQVDDRLAFEALHLIRGGSELLTPENYHRPPADWAISSVGRRGAGRCSTTAGHRRC